MCSSSWARAVATPASRFCSAGWSAEFRDQLIPLTPPLGALVVQFYQWETFHEWLYLALRGWISSKLCQYISKGESGQGKCIHFPSECCRPVRELVIACYFIPSVFPYSLEHSLLFSTFFTAKPYMFVWIEFLSLENLGRNKHFDIFEGLLCVWIIRFVV